MALQVLIPTATGASDQWHTGRAVDMLNLRGVFLHHIHQLLDGPAETPTPNFLEHQHCGWENQTGIIVETVNLFQNNQACVSCDRSERSGAEHVLITIFCVVLLFMYCKWA